MLCLALLIGGVIPALPLRAAYAAVAEPPLPFSWDAEKQGGFVMSLVRDHQGRIWAGTEDKGVGCFDPFAQQGNGWQRLQRWHLLRAS